MGCGNGDLFREEARCATGILKDSLRYRTLYLDRTLTVIKDNKKVISNAASKASDPAAFVAAPKRACMAIGRALVQETIASDHRSQIAKARSKSSSPRLTISVSFHTGVSSKI